MSFGLKNQMNLLKIVRLIAAIKQIEVEVNTCNYDHNLGVPTRPTFTGHNGLKYFWAPKAELLQLNRTQFSSLGVFIS